LVQRRARRDEAGDIGDVDPGSEPVPLRPEAERVVEVLGFLGVDCEGNELAKVDSLGLDTLRLLRKSRRFASDPLMPEQALENRFDVVAPSERALELRPSRSQAEHRQIADRSVAGALAVDDDRRTAFEVGLAHEQLPPAGKLDDGDIHPTRPSAA
jgi:hypothetical protein